MRVCLVSGNADLLQQLLQCGAIKIVCVRPEEEIPEADLYIWEVEPPSKSCSNSHIGMLHSTCLSLIPNAMHCAPVCLTMPVYC